MSVAFDSAADGGFTTAASLTWAHTCTGTQLALRVGVWCSGGNSVTGVTYNGVAMTQSSHIPASSGGSIFDFYVYELLGPATGSHNVVVSLNSSLLVAGNSSSWTGVTGFGNRTTVVNAGTTSFSMSLTPAADSSWVVGISRNDSSSASAGAGTTVRTSGGSSALTTADNNAAISPATSTTLIVTTGASTTWSGEICELQSVSFNPATNTGWRPHFDDILVDTGFDSVDSGFTPRTPADPTDPTP